MEVLSSDDADLRWRIRPSAPFAVALALAAVAAGQAAVVVGPRELPGGTSVQALPNGYSYGTDGDRAVVGFQLRNDGERSLRVVAIGTDLPGLELLDVVASGEPFRYDVVGVGAAPLPPFDLATGTVIEVNLVYRVRRCSEVPRDDQAVPVTAGTGWSRGVLALLLPRQPAAAVDAGPDDEDPWQQVLVRDLC